MVIKLLKILFLTFYNTSLHFIFYIVKNKMSLVIHLDIKKRHFEQTRNDVFYNGSSILARLDKSRLRRSFDEPKTPLSARFLTVLRY